MAAELEKLARQFKEHGFQDIGQHAETLARISRKRGAPEEFIPGSGSLEEEKIESYDQAILEVLGPDLADTPFGRQVRDIGRRIAPHFED